MTKGETMKKHILFDADEIQFVFILNHSWCLSVYPKQWCDVWEFLMFVPTLPRNSQTISCFYIEDILFARPCRCPLCFPLCLLGSFLLPVICAQSLKIAVRSFPLIMYLGLKSIMILKILISIINLYIYIRIMFSVSWCINPSIKGVAEKRTRSIFCSALVATLSHQTVMRWFHVPVL